MSNINGEAGNQQALVLSAGGMFAAYQAGVYKSLWPYWKPDLVVGTSAGALNAWLIAGGIHPDDLIDRWLHPDAGAAVKFRRLHQFWKGCFDPGPLLARARAIQREFPRKLPLGVVSIELPRFHHCLFRNDEITPEHLLATCSILLLYPYVRIDGRRLVDGGLFESTPVWAAGAMGATRIVAVNAFPGVTPWIVKLPLSRMQRYRRVPVSPALDVSLITPSGYMGVARDSMLWDQAKVRRWVEMGREDGERNLEKIVCGAAR